MNESGLEAIRERAAKATPGPWTAIVRCSGNTLDDDEGAGLGFDVDGPPEPMLRGQFSRGPDAAFIAHARSDVPALLRVAVAAQALLDEFRAGNMECIIAAEEALRTALGALEGGEK